MSFDCQARFDRERGIEGSTESIVSLRTSFPRDSIGQSVYTQGAASCVCLRHATEIECKGLHL